MKAVQKRKITTVCVAALVCAACAGLLLSCGKSAAGTEENKLVFWYDDAGYTDFFEQAAESYYKDTGKVVEVKCREDAEYLNAVYDATIQQNGAPDAYLLSSDQLEEAYLYGLAAVNDAEACYLDTVADRAIEASTYRGRMYGYPLSFDTCVLVYQNGYFEQEPESIQAIIDYAIENDPPENVQYLMEWDVNDPFYDFPFVANSIRFLKEDVETMKVEYDQEMYDADLEFFQQILESFSLDAENISEDRVISDFLEGRTLCAILDNNSVSRLDGTDYSMIGIPPLNETLASGSASITDLVLVNDFTDKKKEAADFAEYVTLTMAKELHTLGGYSSVKLSENADEQEKLFYEVYENSVPVPASQDAKEFWVTLKETISQYF